MENCLPDSVDARANGQIFSRKNDQLKLRCWCFCAESKFEVGSAKGQVPDTEYRLLESLKEKSEKKNLSQASGRVGQADRQNIGQKEVSKCARLPLPQLTRCT